MVSVSQEFRSGFSWVVLTHEAAVSLLAGLPLSEGLAGLEDLLPDRSCGCWLEVTQAA